VYAIGPEPLEPLDAARAAVLAAGGVAERRLAGTLLGLDGVPLAVDVALPSSRSGRRAGVRRRDIPPDRIIDIAGIRSTNALQTLLDLAAITDDLVWEQAYEAARRKKLVTRTDFERLPPRLQGAGRIHRVLAFSDERTPPTDSLLETLMIQLARTIPGLPAPTRQFVVLDRHGQFVARVDLVWLPFGLFTELDGQHHEGQPVHDARRETAVVAATGWLCGRFTWMEVARHPRATARRLEALVEQAKARPLRNLPIDSVHGAA
jgi:hypothetical protein